MLVLSLFRAVFTGIILLATLFAAIAVFQAVRYISMRPELSEREPALSIGRSQDQSLDIPGCTKNYSDQPCERRSALIGLHGPRTYFISETGSAYPEVLRGIIIPGWDKAHLMYRDGSPRCRADRFVRFDKWYSQLLETLDPRTATLVLVPDWLAACAMGSAVDREGQQENELYWLIFERDVVGRLDCRRHGSVPNPTCRFELYFLNGEYTLSYGPFTAGNMLRFLGVAPKLAATFIADHRKRIDEVAPELRLDFAEIEIEPETATFTEVYLANFQQP